MFASRSSTFFVNPPARNANKQFGLEVNKYVVMSKFIKSSYEAEPKVSMGYVCPLPHLHSVNGVGANKPAQ
jgi:hypothetical protein